jgi:phytoene desaturase
MAPAGGESLYVLVPTANMQSGIDWEQEAEPFAKRILHFLEFEFGLTGLQEQLQVCKIFTPKDFQVKQNAYYGSAWGVEPKLLQSAVFRPHNRSEDINGLYLVGASTHPGAGLPGVLLTAEATESIICKDMNISARDTL